MYTEGRHFPGIAFFWVFFFEGGETAKAKANSCTCLELQPHPYLGVSI